MNAKQIIETYSLKKHKWVHKGAHSVLHTMYPATIHLLNPLKKYWGDSFKLFVFFIIEDYLHWYYNEEDMTQLRKQVVDKLNTEPSFLKRFEEDWRVLVANFFKKCKKIDKIGADGLLKLSDDELLALYKEFYEAYINEYALAMGLIESFSMQVDLFFRPILEKFLETKGKKKRLNEIFTLLLSPVDESFINNEYRGRLAIIKAIKEGNSGKEINNMLEEHAAKFHWIENNYAKVRALNAAYFKENINNEIKLGIDPDTETKSMDLHFAEVKKKKAELIKELKPQKEILNIIKATEVFAIMQDDRKKCVLISNHYQKMFMNEIGKRVKLNEKEMDYTIFPELKQILTDKKYDKNELAERKKATLVILILKGAEAEHEEEIEQGDKARQAKEYELFSGDVALDVFNELFNPHVDVEEVKGTPASPGKVRGIVKIVRKTHDLASVNKGDILVASMTRPEMVVAMKKASAIITDEGGVTCHAAVISRELCIPCIIGTKIATKIFKNGDMVEVDADKGIVRKVT